MYNKVLIAQMAGELFRRVFSAIIILFRSQNSNPTYDVRIVRASEEEALRSSTLIGMAFAGAMVVSIALLQGLARPTILLAAVFLSIGLSQQIISVCLDVVITHLRAFVSKWNTILYLLARRKNSDEWRFVEDEAHDIFIYPYILHSPPLKLATKVTVSEIIDYIRQNKADLAYDKDIQEEIEELSFAERTLEHLRERLMVHHRLYDIQQKTGAINPILFIAVGTIIWLLS